MHHTEENADIGAHLSDVHIACMGIEKNIVSDQLHYSEKFPDQWLLD